MSHVAKIDIEINDIKALQSAVTDLGGSIRLKNTFKWYGTGTAQTMDLPEGIPYEAMVSCEFAIGFPACDYEVGVYKTNGKYVLLWDDFSRGGLTKVIGTGAGKLIHYYTEHRVFNEAKAMKKKVTKALMHDRTRLTLHV